MPTFCQSRLRLAFFAFGIHMLTLKLQFVNIKYQIIAFRGESMRITKKAFLLSFLLLFFCVAMHLTAGAYDYPSMPANIDAFSVQIGDSVNGYTQIPLSDYPDGAYWDPEKCNLTVSEAASYGISIQNDVALRGWQCVGFARYVYTACFYRYSDNRPIDTDLAYCNGSSSSFYTVGSLPSGYTAAQAKALFTKARPGSVLRISGHSMVLLAIFDDGIYIYDANFSSANEVDVRAYTWDQLASRIGSRGVEVLQMPSHYPDYQYYYYGLPYGINGEFEPDSSVAGDYVTSNYSGMINIRTGPSTDYPVGMQLSEGTVIEVIGSYRNWYAFRYDGQIYWIFKDYIKAYDYVVDVYFDANGGNCQSSCLQYTACAPYGTLPTAWKTNRSFAGWYKDETLVSTSSYVPKTETITLRARWNIYEFKDVSESSWFANYVETGVNYGLIMQDTTFRPNSPAKRSEFITVLGRQYERMSGTQISNSGPAGFTDVISGSFYERYTGWAVEHHIIYGTTNTTFSPSDPITREQIATILYRFVLEFGFDSSYEGTSLLGCFSDGTHTDNYAKTAMNWAISIGLFKGDNYGRLNPLASATRAEMITVFDRFLEYYEL